MEPEITESAPVNPTGETKPAVIESVQCPGCGAELRRVSAEPGAKIRCLNCGARFSLASDVSIATQTAPQMPVTAGKEPTAPGYWLLRIPAILWFGASCVIGGFATYNMIHDYILFWNSNRLVADLLVPVAYLQLIPLSGILAFMLTRAMARIDSASVRLAWRRGVIATMTPPEGSSLPYVAPLAVFGGLLPIIFIAVNESDESAILAGILFSGLTLYAGFAVEDLRQFIWRQETLAMAYCRASGVQTTPIKLKFSVTALFAAGIPLLMATGIMSLVLRIGAGYTYSPRRQDLTILAGIMSGALAIAFTLARLARNWDRTVAMWQFASQATQMNVKPGRNRFSETWSRSPFAIIMTLTPLLWLGWSAIWLCVDLYNYPFSSREGLGLTLMLTAAVFSALLLAWHPVQTLRWMGSLRICGDVAENPAKTPWICILIVLCTVLLCATQLILILISVLDRIGSVGIDRVLLLPVMIGIMHYPTLWCMYMTIQFLNLETDLNAVHDAAA